MDTLFKDVQYAIRQLRRSPGFALTAILTLSLGIGATTAIFTLIYQVMLRPLPVTEPQQLYKLGARYDCCYNSGSLFGDWSLFSWDQYKLFRDHLHGFSSLAALEAGEQPVGMRVEGSTEAAQPVRLQFVSGNYFSTLGVDALAGRTLQPGDDQRSAPLQVVLSYRLWQRRFGGSNDVLGKAVILNGHPLTVVGILPASFFGTRVDADPAELWAPLSSEPMLTNVDAMDHPAQYWLYIVGRARPGFVPADTTAQVTGLLQDWLRAHPETLSPGQSSAIARQRTEWVAAASGISALRDSYASGLRLLFLIAGFVLLIVCANLANLTLVRGMGRRQQTAVRIALGSQRSRVIRQTLIECLLVSVLGGAVAVLVAVFASRAMLAVALTGAESSPFSSSPSPAVLGFALVAALLSAALFGCIPAWITSHFDPVEALRGTTRTAGGQTSWQQKALVVLQAALSVALLSTAGLVVLSLRALERQDLHLATSGRLVIGINAVAAGYGPQRLTALEQKLDTQLRQVPGVLDVGYAEFSPMSHDAWHDLTYLPGTPPPAPEFTGNSYRTTEDRVSPGYFAAVGTHILLGRGFTDTDTVTTQHVAVVNQAFMNRFLKGKSPLGAHFGMNQEDPSEFEIVGVVDDTKYEDPEHPQLPMAFFPISQPAKIFKEQQRAMRDRSLYPYDIVVHYQGSEAEMAAALRRTLGTIDPNLPITRMDTLETQVNSNFNQPEMLARLTSVFGIVALLLAAIGIYGVTAYTVERRTPEVGLRMALGASRGDVLRGVLRSALAQVGLGLGLGIPLAVALGRLMAAHLYQVSSSNPLVLAASLLTLLAAAVLAAFIPARRAAAIEPIVALRNQ